MLSDFFGFQRDGYKFVYFGLSHIIPIIILIFLIVLLYLFRNQIKNFKYEANIRYYFGALIILTQMSYTYNNIYISEITGTAFATVTKDLPLSLCGISMILTGLLFYNKSKKLFDITYFWVLCGALLAILLPSAIANERFGHYGPDKFRYYQFWIGHIGIILIIFYMIFIHKYKITKKSLLYSFVWLNLFGIFVIIINNLIGSNYLFIQKPDETGLSFLPKYPFSIIAFEILAIIFYIIAYLPWWFKTKKIKKDSIDNNRQYQ